MAIKIAGGFVDSFWFLIHYLEIIFFRKQEIHYDVIFFSAVLIPRVQVSADNLLLPRILYLQVKI